MTCELYLIAFNESLMLDLTIEHYKQFCTKVIVFDNHSTDDTALLAQRMGCEVRKFGTPGILSDADYLTVKNHAWKESKADWVIVCDADEILWHPEIKHVLSEEKGSIFPTQGYSFYSKNLPIHSFSEVKTCVLDDNYSKRIIFSPRRLKEIGYIYGCHECRPTGDVVYSPVTMDVLHYKYVGGIERVLERHRLYKSRLSDINKRWNLGHTYSLPEQEQIDHFNKMLAKCEEYPRFLQDGGS
jgi:glycosyltransferase involved in cell wall biosynthesis